MSVERVNTSVLSPTRALVSALALERTSARRPMMASRDTPASASALEMARPMPDPPPVITADFPSRDSSGRVGSMLG
jgi:hypothetical protein